MAGLMSVSRTQLLSRKRDLFAALRTLERDYDDGVIDEVAYRSAVERYEAEAAGILERLDTMPPDEEQQRIERPSISPWSFSRAFAAGAAVLVIIAIGLFLVAATHHRVGNEAITGSEGAPSAPTAAPVPRAVTSAQQAVRQHPKSVSALLGLGNAYFDSGNVAAANRSYNAAIKMAPHAPEPRVLQAMAIGLGGNPTRADALLRGVERAHPAYARAWLLDGLFTAHTRRGYARAIQDWRHFLALDPHSPMTSRVHQWLAAARREEKGAK